jgi:hypothetical protein
MASANFTTCSDAFSIGIEKIEAIANFVSVHGQNCEVVFREMCTLRMEAILHSVLGEIVNAATVYNNKKNDNFEDDNFKEILSAHALMLRVFFNLKAPFALHPSELSRDGRNYGATALERLGRIIPDIDKFYKKCENEKFKMISDAYYKINNCSSEKFKKFRDGMKKILTNTEPNAKLYDDGFIGKKQLNDAMMVIAICYVELLHKHNWYKEIPSDVASVDILISDNECRNFTLCAENHMEIFSSVLQLNAEITEEDRVNFTAIFNELQSLTKKFEETLNSKGVNKNKRWPEKMSLKYIESIYIMYLNECLCDTCKLSGDLTEFLALLCGKENHNKLKAKVAYVMCENLIKKKYTFDEFPEWNDFVYSLRSKQ